MLRGQGEQAKDRKAQHVVIDLVAPDSAVSVAAVFGAVVPGVVVPEAAAAAAAVEEEPLSVESEAVGFVVADRAVALD